jgi:hypothetical protein
MKPVSDRPEEHLTACIVNLRNANDDEMRAKVVNVVLTEDSTAGNKDVQDILSKHQSIVNFLEKVYGLDIFADQFSPKNLVELRRVVWGVSKLVLRMVNFTNI